MKYIIGGGISGLIFAYYNPDFTIISPDIGGQMTHGMHSMTWIHDTPETRKLLEDLGVQYTQTKTSMGYYYDGFIHDDCSEIANTKIIKKKMSDWTNTSDNFQIKDTTLSVPETFINTLNTDFNEVIKRLSEKIRVINDYIVGIDDMKIIGQNEEYRYDALVSTMPAKVFWNAYYKYQFNIEKPSLNLESTPVTFIISSDKFEWYDDKYEMVYIAEDYFFTRVSNRGLDYVYEFTGVMPEIVFKKVYFPNVKKYYVNNFGRIHTVENIPPQENILFLGRFAEWKHSSKIQNVINVAINNNNKL